MNEKDIQTIHLPIHFNTLDEAESKQQLHFAARLALKMGISRVNFALMCNHLDSIFKSYALGRYDGLKNEKARNHERNTELARTGKLNQKKKKIGQRQGRAYERLATVPIADVFARMGKTLEVKGATISVRSKRYRCYARNGITCVRCGLEATYFAVERQGQQRTSRWHLNLYHRFANGKERMMTVDHIIPKSRGGPDNVNNMQPMCSKCNGAKGARTEEELKDGVSHAVAQARAEVQKNSLTATAEIA